jgi:plasmid maintenance system antidote protein VapI
LKDSERLKKVLELKGIKPSELAKKLNLPSAQGLYDILNNKMAISKKMADKICSLYTDIKKEWLLLDLDNMLVNDNVKIANAADSLEIANLKKIISDQKAVIEYLKKQHDDLVRTDFARSSELPKINNDQTAGLLNRDTEILPIVAIDDNV